MFHLEMSWLSSFLLATVLLFPAGDAAMLGAFYKAGECAPPTFGRPRGCICTHAHTSPLPSTAFVLLFSLLPGIRLLPLQMVVMWSTESSSSTVLYGRFAYDLVMKECREFTKGNLKDLQYVHSGSAGIGHSTTRLGLFF